MAMATPQQLIETVPREELTLHIQEWLSHFKNIPLRIVLGGRVGRGKSALVNSLLECDLADEGFSPDPVTEQVQSYRKVVNGVNITIFDTPGLYSTDSDESAKKVLGEIVKETAGEKGVHLVLFCVKMTDRIIDYDKKAMKQLTDVFEESMWKNAIFVLTYANEFRPQRRRFAAGPQAAAQQPNDARVQFVKLRDDFAKTLRTSLHAAGVSEAISQGVPVIPAGYDQPELPDCEDWFVRFWKEAFERAKSSGRIALLKVRSSWHPTLEVLSGIASIIGVGGVALLAFILMKR